MKKFSRDRSSGVQCGVLGAKRLATADLPIVDVGPLLAGSERARRDVGEALGAAARDLGFFYISGHGIGPDLLSDAYAQSEAFFHAPLAFKMHYDIARSENHRGYVPITETGDYADEQGGRHYEAFDSAFDLPASDPASRDFYLMGPNVWPNLLGFRRAISSYYRAVHALGRSLCRGFELHLGLRQGYFDDFCQRPTSQLRLLHYLERDAPPKATDMNMGAHTDYECFTILHQQAPGLQVLSRRGEWLEVPPIDGTFVVNIGDMLEIWTNGAFRSNVHRVVVSGRERYSMPFFYAADFDAVIEPAPTTVTTHSPPRYGATVAGHHLMGQLLRDFSYLRARHDAGKLPLGFEIPNGNPFEVSKVAAAMAA